MERPDDNDELQLILQHYRSLMNKSGDLIFSVSRDGKVLFANTNFRKAIGYDEELLKKLNFNSILHYQSTREFKRLFSILAEHENVQLHLVTKQGKELIIEGNCTTFKEDDTMILKGLFHDITNDFKKRLVLERSEVKFKMLFEKSLNPIVYYDSKGIIDCNKAFVEILGFDSKDEIIGRLPSEFSAKHQPNYADPRKAAWKIDNLALQNGGHQFEWMHKKKNGEEFLVSASMSVIELDGKKAFFAMWNDLSIRHRTDKEIKQKQEEIRLKDRRLAVLAAVNQLIISDMNFVDKSKEIMQAITSHLPVKTTNISVVNADMTEIMSYAYSTLDETKFYGGKNFDINKIPGKQKLVLGQHYYNPEITAEAESEIERNLYSRNLRSILSIPISTEGQLSGFLSSASEKPNGFDEELIDLFHDLSSSIAIFIKQHKQIELSQKYSELEDSLHSLGTKILESLNIEEIGMQLYSEVNEIMDAPIFGFGIHDDVRNVLEFKGIVEYGELLPPFEFSLDDNESLGVICFRNGVDVVINDFDTDVFKYLDAYDRSKLPGKPPESLVYLPLLFKGKKIGVITAQSYSKGKYKDKNIFVLKALASYVAIAAHNATLYETSEEKVDLKTQEIIMQKIRLQKANYQQQMISAIGRKISSNLNLEKVFVELHEQVDKLMDATIFGIRIYSKEKDAIEYRYEIESGVLSNDGFIPMSNKDNYSVWCLENNQPIFINNNLREYKKFVNEIHVVAGEMPESLLFQPLYINDEPLGVITVQSFYKNAYNKSHLEMLASLANYTSMAIQNASTHEKLTKELESLRQGN